MKILFRIDGGRALLIEPSKHCRVLLLLFDELAQAALQHSWQRLSQKVAQDILGQRSFEEHGLFIKIERIELVITEPLRCRQARIAGRIIQMGQHLRNEPAGKINRTSANCADRFAGIHELWVRRAGRKNWFQIDTKRER